MMATLNDIKKIAKYLANLCLSFSHGINRKNSTVFTIINKKKLKFYLLGIICGIRSTLEEYLKCAQKRLTFLRTLNSKTLIHLQPFFRFTKIIISFMP